MVKHLTLGIIFGILIAIAVPSVAMQTNDNIINFHNENTLRADASISLLPDGQLEISANRAIALYAEDNPIYLNATAVFWNGEEIVTRNWVEGRFTHSIEIVETADGIAVLKQGKRIGIIKFDKGAE